MGDLRAAFIRSAAVASPLAIRAPVSIALGSLLAALPFVSTIPIQPPFGLLMLLAWRIRRPDVFPPWAPVALGLLDDLVSGQPLGSAMFFWTLATLAIAVLDTRLVWRTFALDWLTAAAALLFCLIGGRLVATPLVSHVDAPLLVQIAASIALWPVAARLVAWLDRRRIKG